MARKTDGNPKPLNKAQTEALVSGLTAAARRLSADLDLVGIDSLPAAYRQPIAYQVSMVRYGVRQMEALAGNLTKVVAAPAPARQKSPIQAKRSKAKGS